MNEENLGYIGDFVDIETFVNNESFETSDYTGLEEFFSEHLDQSNIDKKVKLDGINVFRIQIGDKITVSPSNCTISFREKHELPNDNSSYEIEYIIENIRIEFFTENPRNDSGFPLLQIRIYLGKA